GPSSPEVARLQARTETAAEAELVADEPSWTADELEARVLAELAADGAQIPPQALDIQALPAGAWRLELRSDDGERRWRDLAALPKDLDAAAASARIVLLELLEALPRKESKQ
ncbi:MAG: hypothetical protein AAGD10_19810, partial [Myxococcota bacterium]